MNEKLNFLGNNVISEDKKTIEVVSISGENVDKLSQIVDNLGGTYEDLGYGYGIINISVDKLDSLMEVKEFQYIELPKVLYTTDFYSNRDICVNQLQSTYSTYGEGVLVGFIDTGIDYNHPGFKNEDGTTRIEYIWDLDLKKVFNKEQINEALKAPEPLSVVPSYDLIGHGTHVVGIACAGGKIPRDRYGVASKASIAMVKATRGRFSISTQIMRGIKFLVDKSRELNMPLAINISLSTNDGAHNGSSLLEKYIQTVCDLERVTIVIAAGNEGAASHHVGGELREEQNIDINVELGEKSLNLSLFLSVLSRISIQITNPAAKTTGEFTLRQGFNEVGLDGDRVLFYVSGPKPFDLTGEILISLVARGEELISGTWVLKIKSLNKYTGRYDIWLPISEGLNPNTKFLNPTLFNTLGIPATVSNVISVGSYNNVTNNISPFSGRGQLFSNGNIKPELIAPGENITSLSPGGFDTKTGTSMATPHVTGVVALFMEWGIVKGNDKFLFGERLKNYLVRGAKRDRPDEIYPNPIWGYGTLCAYNSLEILREELNIPMVGNRINRARRIIEYYGDITSRIANFPEATVIILDERTAVIEAPYNVLVEILKNVSEIVYVESSPVYTLNLLSPVEASGANLFHNNPYLSLTGRGVLVGIIDSGIDYLNKEFMREDDTTRIVSLWDQTVSGNPVTWHDYGRVFEENEINEAIKLSLSGGDPYTIVNSKDEIGHGTMVAGLVGARGINPELIGAAPDCEFIIVKLKEASPGYLSEAGVTIEGRGRYENADIVLGIRHIIEVARQKLMPLILYIPLGTSMGSHDGHTIIERYIDDLSKRRGVVIVTCTGNEGDSDIHTEGTLTGNGDIKTIELVADKNQTNLNFEIWFRKPDKVALSIISPSGEVIEKIPARLNQIEEIRFVFEKTIMYVQYLIPEEITGDEAIRIKIKDLKEGIWQFRLIGDYIIDGRYNAWLPQRQLISPGTKFLNSSQYITLNMPSTAESTIVAAYYNQNNMATVGKSGRGFTRDGRIKPDIAAGGVDALTITPGGGAQISSGSSVAGAVLAGCCALLMQWGIVEDNDPTMYSVKMKAYIIRGAKMREGDIYPNREWGYGMLDIKGVFDSMRASNTRGNYQEYDVNGLFVRKLKN